MADIHYIRKTEHKMISNSFKELFLWTCLTVEQATEMCGVTKKTFKAWLKNNSAPVASRRLLEWYYFGVPQVKTFEGWKIRNGELLSPSDQSFNSRHIEMIPILHQWMSSQEAQFKERKKYRNKNI